MNATTLHHCSISRRTLTALALIALAAVGATHAQAQIGLTNRSQIIGGSQFRFGSVPSMLTRSPSPKR